MTDEPKDDLTAKVVRINVLQRLVSQDVVNLRLKAPAADRQELSAINEEIQDFLQTLLERELGISQPGAAMGLPMFSPEKLAALDTLLTRLVAGKPATAAPPMPPTPHIPIPSDGRPGESTQEYDPNTASVHSTPNPSPRRPMRSPLMQAVISRAGGEEAWKKMSQEERAVVTKSLAGAALSKPAG